MGFIGSKVSSFFGRQHDCGGREHFTPKPSEVNLPFPQEFGQIGSEQRKAVNFYFILSSFLFA